jgi:hypothetical protein
MKGRGTNAKQDHNNSLIRDSLDLRTLRLIEGPINTNSTSRRNPSVTINNHTAWNSQPISKACSEAISPALGFCLDFKTEQLLQQKWYYFVGV